MASFTLRTGSSSLDSTADLDPQARVLLLATWHYLACEATAVATLLANFETGPKVATEVHFARGMRVAFMSLLSTVRDIFYTAVTGEAKDSSGGEDADIRADIFQLCAKYRAYGSGGVPSDMMQSVLDEMDVKVVETGSEHGSETGSADGNEGGGSDDDDDDGGSDGSVDTLADALEEIAEYEAEFEAFVPESPAEAKLVAAINALGSRM